MLIFSDVNATFLHNPKAAGTSIKTWIRETAGYRPDNIVCDPHDVAVDKIKGFTFCCVRNPYQKMVSAYEYLSRFAGGKFRCSSFNEFIDDFDDERMHPFNRKQSYYSKHCDYIMRFENLENDFKVIQEYFKCDKPLSVMNVAEYNKYDWKQYYNNTTKQRVKELCQEDLDLFNYEF